MEADQKAIETLRTKRESLNVEHRKNKRFFKEFGQGGTQHLTNEPQTLSGVLAQQFAGNN